MPDAPAQLLFSALVIIADWIASAEDLFPLFKWEKDWAVTDAVRISAGRAKSSKQTSELTGLPGKPNTSVCRAPRRSTPNHNGLPGLSCTL